MGSPAKEEACLFPAALWQAPYNMAGWSERGSCKVAVGDLSRRLCDAATEVATGGRLCARGVMSLQEHGLSQLASLATYEPRVLGQAM